MLIYNDGSTVNIVRLLVYRTIDSVSNHFCGDPKPLKALCSAHLCEAFVDVKLETHGLHACIAGLPDGRGALGPFSQMWPNSFHYVSKLVTIDNSF